MSPHDLNPELLILPGGDRKSAVLFTGHRPRDVRVGYLLQRRFPGVLRLWYVAQTPADEPSSRASGGILSQTTFGPAALQKLKRFEVAEVFAMTRRWMRSAGARKTAAGVLRHALPAPSDRTLRVEREMFQEELDDLQNGATCSPVEVPSFDLEQVVADVRSVQPYFVVASGGPPVSADVLRCVRGVSLACSTAWPPILDGSRAAEGALYHRQLACLGSTVHLLSAHRDRPMILRRSTATVHADDSPEHCALAAHAVGATLLLDVLHQAFAESALQVFSCPPAAMRVADTDLTADSRNAIGRDFAAGWLPQAVSAMKDF